jgi:hydrogenase/urease accessory protein HupE
LAAISLMISLNGAGVALAHDPGLSVATAHLNAGTLSIYLALARSDVERLVSLDADHDGHVTEKEFQAALPHLDLEAQRAFSVRCGGQLLAPCDTIVTRDDREGLHFALRFCGTPENRWSICSRWIDELPRGHRQFLSVLDEGNARLGEAMLDVAHNLLEVQPRRNTQPAATPHSFRDFLALGVMHIATGYDHLLFLLGLLLVGGSLRAALQIITSFTLAHSITLALATLNILNIPPHIIEPLIAVSIVVVGLQNILSRSVEKRWLLTFGFGLIHGCGFASALRDLGIRAVGGGIVIPLVSFNLGVELGQLAIAALALPIIWKCQASPVFVWRVVPVGSGMIALAGGYWLIERTML